MPSAVRQIEPNEPAQTLAPEPRKSFVATPAVKSVSERAFRYLQAGYPIHFRGPAGTGKTTLAFHVASLTERPIILVTGDEEFKTSDLIGSASGVRTKRVVDRYIHSVVKVEENVNQTWIDNQLTTACVEGCVLVYDEFTRSRPEANNVFLGVLEEKLLVLPNSNGGESYIKVHPEFRAIFTSNPLEYVGVHKSQDALSDRMITIDVEGYDRVTEVAIAVAHSGLQIDCAISVVDIVRTLRQANVCRQQPTVRAAIMLARICNMVGCRAAADDAEFIQTCRDVLESKIRDDAMPGRTRRQILNGVILRALNERRKNGAEQPTKGRVARGNH